MASLFSRIRPVKAITRALAALDLLLGRLARRLTGAPDHSGWRRMMGR